MDKADCEEAVPHFRARDLDMIGQSEGSLERAGGDTPMEIGDAVFRLFIYLASDKKGFTLCRNAQVIQCKARNCHHDAVLVFSKFLDVIRGVGINRSSVP